MLKYLFMDFDGVITDTETEVYRLMRDWIVERTGHILTLEEYAIAAGAWHVELVNYINRKYDSTLDEEAFFAFARSLEERALGHLPLLPGVARWLEDAKALGISCAMARTIHSRLAYLSIRDRFRFVLTAEDTKALKPAPDLYLKALEKADVHTEEALVIEDSMNGIRAASAAGLRTLAVPCSVTNNYAFPEAWIIAHSLKEVSLASIARRFTEEEQ